MDSGSNVAYKEARQKSDWKSLGRYLDRPFWLDAIPLGRSDCHDMLRYLGIRSAGLSEPTQKSNG
jgi:hypothetical protein